MHSQYDLVKVINPDDKGFYGAIGIIEEADKDIDGDYYYQLLFVGNKHNQLSREKGIRLFYDENLEGI